MISATAVRHDIRHGIGDTPGKLSLEQMAHYHHIAFRKFGIRPDFYGGTWLGSVPDDIEMKAYGDLYCHDCDTSEGYQPAGADPMKRLGILVPALLLGSGCAPGPNERGEDARANCLLNQYQLPPLTQADEQGDTFDASDNLHGLRVEIPAAIMADHIPRYNSHIRVGSAEQPQFLYLTFSEPYEAIRFKKDLAEPIEEHDKLFRIAGESQYSWDLAEKVDGELTLWGSCSDNFQGSYDCMAHLPANGFAVNYELHQANLPVYKDVEVFLRKQLDACELNNQ